MQVAANAYGVPPSQSAQAAVAAVTAATAAAVNGQQIPPGVGGTQQAAGTAVQAALAAQQGAGLTAAAALAQQVGVIWNCPHKRKSYITYKINMTSNLIYSIDL